jgi:hypothetical protein
MKAYGTRITGEEADRIIDYIEGGELQRNTSFERAGEEALP